MPKPVWIVEGLLTKGRVSVLIGDGGIGKSYLALDLALSMASGDSWLEHPIPQRGVVIYVAGEGEDDIPERLMTWEIARGMITPPEFILVTDTVQLLDRDDVDEFIDYARDVSRDGNLPLELIILDTLSCMFSGEENSGKEMKLAVLGADHIARKTGAHVMLLHHTNKIGGIRGHTSLRDNTNTSIMVKETQTGIVLECWKQKSGPDFKPIFLRTRTIDLPEGGTNIVWDVDHEDHSPRLDITSSPSHRRRTEKQRLLDLLPHRGLTREEWLTRATAEGIKATTFNATLNRLRKDKAIREEFGRFLPPA